MTNVFLKIWYKYSQGHSFVMDFSLSTIIITNLHFTLSANLPQYLDAFALHIKINLLLPKCSLRLASPQLNSFFNKSLKSKDSRCSSTVSTNMLLRLWRQSVKKNRCYSSTNLLIVNTTCSMFLQKLGTPASKFY